MSEFNCYLCQEPKSVVGHNNQSCPNVKCKKCGQKGHIFKNCPNLNLNIEQKPDHPRLREIYNDTKILNLVEDIGLSDSIKAWAKDEILKVKIELEMDEEISFKETNCFGICERKLMAPMGMDLGPRFYMRPWGRPPAPERAPEVTGPHPRHPGSRGIPPSAPPPGGLLPTPAIRDRLGERPWVGGRGMGRDMDHSSRGSLKRSMSTPHHEGPRAKMPSYSHSSSYNGGWGGDAGHHAHAATHGVGAGATGTRVLSNLCQIQTVDEPMQTAPPSHHHHSTQQSYHSVPPPSLSHHQQRGPHIHDPNHHQRYHVNNLVSDNAGRGGRGGFRVNHTPAPSLTQIQTVDNSRHQPRPSAAPQAAAPRPAMPVGNVNSNLRSIPTVGSGSNAPTPLMGNTHKITKTGGMSSRVLISNLPPMMSFERISAMTTAAGNVRNINVNDNATAIVEFANPSSAENFIRTSNRKVIDRSMITVARLA